MNHKLIPFYKEMWNTYVRSLMRQEFINKLLNSDKIIYSILRGTDIKRYLYEFTDLWQIYSHNSTTNLLTIDVFNYPAFNEYFDYYYDHLTRSQDEENTHYYFRSCACNYN